MIYLKLKMMWKRNFKITNCTSQYWQVMHVLFIIKVYFVYVLENKHIINNDLLFRFYYTKYIISNVNVCRISFQVWYHVLIWNIFYLEVAFHILILRGWCLRPAKNLYLSPLSHIFHHENNYPPKLQRGAQLLIVGRTSYLSFLCFSIFLH